MIILSYLYHFYKGAESKPQTNRVPTSVHYPAESKQPHKEPEAKKGLLNNKFFKNMQVVFFF